MRNSPRVAVDMPLTFKLLRGKSVLPEDIAGQVVDIGYGGMYIVTPLRLDAFSNIRIALSLSLLGKNGDGP